MSGKALRFFLMDSECTATDGVGLFPLWGLV